MLAVLNGHAECVYYLINKGANVGARDKWGRTALHRGVSWTYVTYLQIYVLYVCICVCVSVADRLFRT